jgi:porphobilinogen synthase
MVRETRLAPEDFVMPYFVRSGDRAKIPVSAMPGNYQMSPDVLLDELKPLIDLGVPAILLFGIPDSKDAMGSAGYAEDGIIQRAVQAVKATYPNLTVITDVCLCEYTDHGHCGVVVNRDVDNDRTLELLAKMAVSHARAGADMVAPSDMMDGRVAAIREALDDEGFTHIPIMSYAAKFASAFYGPFRDAAESAPKFGDRRSYQMDPANGNEAIMEVALDVEEGADIVMVKPALPYLDIIRRVKDMVDIPVAAYNVSGEFSMIKAAAANGWLDETRCMMEALTSIKRAGADIIITYFAVEASRKLLGGGKVS